MEKLNKDELKQFAYNCRKATFLIEKEQISSLTLQEKLELDIHLIGCSMCQVFQKQSIVINRFVKNILNNPRQGEPGLGENFKKDLQERIKQKLNDK